MTVEPSTMTTTLPIDPTLTINEVVARHPETIPVFNRLGLDTCCGGGVSLTDAARRDGLDLAALLVALSNARSGA